MAFDERERPRIGAKRQELPASRSSPPGIAHKGVNLYSRRGGCAARAMHPSAFLRGCHQEREAPRPLPRRKADAAKPLLKSRQILGVQGRSPGARRVQRGGRAAASLAPGGDTPASRHNKFRRHDRQPSTGAFSLLSPLSSLLSPLSSPLGTAPLHPAASGRLPPH